MMPRCWSVMHQHFPGSLGVRLSGLMCSVKQVLQMQVNYTEQLLHFQTNNLFQYLIAMLQVQQNLYSQVLRERNSRTNCCLISPVLFRVFPRSLQGRQIHTNWHQINPRRSAMLVLPQEVLILAKNKALFFKGQGAATLMCRI